ncbi:C40 family peptidase [Trujillonella endophytica]|uniref:Cell wall-associated hydrolase, NlpC family n=1 Tax=Trujillonella endophytica TaxID=673521 RepID=A0A1H8VNL9_9ACTN|nr:C40 family peptidase [Trujillella endophytica]SEP16883.1 Cell wall-associated hydrolase, NlpC family [Trujillella endophytica]
MGTTAALTITTLPGTATADPTTATSPEQAAQLVAEASSRLEAVSEQVNEARETLGLQELAVAAARQEVEEARAQLDSLDGQLRQVARSAYTGGAGEGLATLDLLMTSSSAEDFVSSLTFLDQIAGHTTGVLAEVSDAADEAAQAEAEAAEAEAAARRTLEDLSGQEDQLQADVAEYQQQYDRLSAAQQAQVQQAQVARTGQAVAPAAVARPVAASGSAQVAVDTALAQVGDAYVWGASGPNAFDCSGLTQYAYAAAGVSLPHSSRMQAQMGTAVSRAELQPGDLLFYYSPISHVSMYVGNGQMVHASTSGQPVKVVSIDSMGGITAMRRIL